MTGKSRATQDSLAALARRTATVCAVVTAFGLAVATILFASDVFLLVCAGILVSIFLRRLASLIASPTRLPYSAALALVIVLLLVITTGLGWFLVPSLTSQWHDLSRDLPDAFERFRARLSGIDWLDKVIDKMPSPEKLATGHSGLWSRVTGFVSGALSIVADLVVVAFVGLYIALAPGLYRHGLLALVPPHNRVRANEVLQKLDHTLWWWLIAKLIAMGIIGVLTAIGLGILGIPAAAVLGVIAAVLTFIPNFGPVISAAPAILLAMTQGPRQAGLVGLLYLVIQAIETYLITPNIEKRTINLPPALTISVQVLMGMLAGALGLVVATPLCATSLVLVRELYVKRATADADTSHAR